MQDLSWFSGLSRIVHQWHEYSRWTRLNNRQESWPIEFENSIDSGFQFFEFWSFQLFDCSILRSFHLVVYQFCWSVECYGLRNYDNMRLRTNHLASSPVALNHVSLPIWDIRIWQEPDPFMICMEIQPGLIQCYDVIPTCSHLLLQNSYQASRGFDSCWQLTGC
jgi:hypothetical protein